MAVGIQRFDTVLNKMDSDGNDTENHKMNSAVNKRMNALPENLKLNGRTPSGKPRLFVCQICTRAFARQEHLTRHERSHTKEKPYCCGICSRKFSRRDLLLRHAHKIHVDNYDDSIIMQNKEKGKRNCEVSNSNANNSNSSRVNKCGRSRSVRTSAGIEKGLNTAIPSDSNSSVIKKRRRASYSAQSGNYVPPPQNEQWQKARMVKFSTPDLLPVRMIDDTFSNDTNNINNGLLENMGPLDLGTHLEFDALNSSNSNDWIGAYGNNFSSASKSATLEDNLIPNNSRVEKFIETANEERQHEMINDYLKNNTELRKSPWSINEQEGELRINVQSLFRNRNNSVPLSKSTSEKQHGVELKSISELGATSARTTTPTTMTNTDFFPISKHAESSSPSAAPSCVFDNENSNVNPRNLSQQLDHLQFDENVPESLQNFVEDVQPIFGRFIEDEQSSDLYCIPQSFSTLSDNGEDLVNVSMGSLDRNLKTDHDNYTFYGLDFLSASNITRAPPPSNLKSDNFPPTKLFSSELRQMCLYALKYYNEYRNNGEGGFLNSDPVLLSKDLIVPSCNELNEYLSYFQKYFNPHGAFIHPDFFQLDLMSLKNYTSEGSMSIEGDFEFFRYSNIVCLPIYAATVGSLFKTGCYPKSMELYEISRRVLHVYLERRKQKSIEISKSGRLFEDRQPIWLIQSLTLSITFALFTDYLERMDFEMITRQVGSICSIIHGNFLKIISINSHEFFPSYKGRLNFNNSCDYIFFESKIRCTLMIYKICQFLKIFYHIESEFFLNENDLNPMFIPDDEVSWISSSLLVPNKLMRKKYTVDFQRFYHSFTFNNIGMHSIPECLSSAMLYYEYNASNFSTFHVFLTRIDTKKLELNQTQISRSNLKLAIECNSILNSDSIILRNCLMSMAFLTKLHFPFGFNEVGPLFTSFLDPSSFNVLGKGSYGLLTDFLVALNFSIRNVAHFLAFIEDKAAIEPDKTELSLFNCQGLYFNFLILIKFVLDFECTPNFKLLCIFTELKKLANNLLIPKYSGLYPKEFAKFQDVSTINECLQHQPTSESTSESTSTFSTINEDKFEKLISNVLVHSFNDASLLNVSDQSATEVPFNKNYPSVYPCTFPEGTAFDYEEMSFENTYDENDLLSFRPAVNMSLYQNANNNNGRGGNDNCIDNDVTRMAAQNDSGGSNVSKQKFLEMSQLSDEYITIAKCFFAHVRETYAHCHVFKKMVADFQQLENCITQKKTQIKAQQENGSKIATEKSKPLQPGQFG